MIGIHLRRTVCPTPTHGSDQPNCQLWLVVAVVADPPPMIHHLVEQLQSEHIPVAGSSVFYLIPRFPHNFELSKIVATDSCFEIANQRLGLTGCTSSRSLHNLLIRHLLLPLGVSPSPWNNTDPNKWQWSYPHHAKMSRQWKSHQVSRNPKC